MTRGKTGLSLGEYAILGILRGRPVHGYEVTRHFAPERDLALVLPIEMGTVYTLLKDLQETGLIEGERQVVGARPPRTVFHLTAEAEAQFQVWLEQPVRRLREVRADLLVKLYFCRSTSVALTRRLLNVQLVESAAYLARLNRLATDAGPDSFERLVHDSKSGAARATLAWLESERARLDG